MPHLREVVFKNWTNDKTNFPFQFDSLHLQNSQRDFQFHEPRYLRSNEEPDLVSVISAATSILGAFTRLNHRLHAAHFTVPVSLGLLCSETNWSIIAHAIHDLRALSLILFHAQNASQEHNQGITNASESSEADSTNSSPSMPPSVSHSAETDHPINYHSKAPALFLSKHLQQPSSGSMTICLSGGARRALTGQTLTFQSFSSFLLYNSRTFPRETFKDQDEQQGRQSRGTS